MKTEEWYVLTKAYDKAEEAVDELKTVIRSLGDRGKKNVFLENGSVLLNNSIEIIGKVLEEEENEKR